MFICRRLNCNSTSAQNTLVPALQGLRQPPPFRLRLRRDGPQAGPPSSLDGIAGMGGRHFAGRWVGFFFFCCLAIATTCRMRRRVLMLLRRVKSLVQFLPGFASRSPSSPLYSEDPFLVQGPLRRSEGARSTQHVGTGAHLLQEVLVMRPARRLQPPPPLPLPFPPLAPTHPPAEAGQGGLGSNSGRVLRPLPAP